MKSFPFDSEVTYGESGEPIYDRASKSQDLRDYFSLMYTDGVFPNPSTGLQVTTSTQSMSVTVKPGAAIIQGAFAIEDRDRTIVFEAADENMDRIDSVVIRLNTNLNYRTIDIYVVKGKAAAQPAAPALTREGGIYELRIANVFVAKGTTTISKARITDTRLNSRDCGIAACNPQKVETSAIYDQYQASLDEWLQYVADCIDGTTAGNLQKQISALNAKVPFGFGVDQEGNAGYIKPGEDHITLFGSGTVNLQTASIDHQSGNTATIQIAAKGTAHMQLIVHRTVDASFPAQTYTVKKNDTVIKTETISGPNQTKTIDISVEVNVGDVITFTSTSGSYLYVFASLYVETATSGTGGAPVYNVVLERLQETEDKANEASEKAAQVDSVREEIVEIYDMVDIGSEVIDITPKTFTQGRIKPSVDVGSQIAFETSSSWYYTSVDVTGYHKAEVKFRATSNWKNYIVGVDAAGTVKKIFTTLDDTNSEIVRECEITSGIVKLYITCYALNTYANFYVKGYAFIKIADKVSENTDDISNIKETVKDIDVIKTEIGTVKTKTIEVTVEKGNPIIGRVNGTVGGNVSFGTETYWRHFNVDVSEGDVLSVTTYPSTSSFKNYIVFTNDDGLIIDIPTEAASSVVPFTTDCIVPQGATKMYVTVNAGDDAGALNRVSVVRTYVEIIDLQTQINELTQYKFDIKTIAEFNTALFDVVNYEIPIVLL